MRISLLIAIFFMACTAYAQELKFTLGPAMAEYPDGYTAFFNTTLKKGYQIAGKEQIVTVLDDYIKVNGAGIPIKAEVFTGKQKAIIEGFHTIGEKNYILYSTLDKASNEQNVYIQELSSAMLLLGSPIKVTSFKDAKERTREIVIGSPTSLVNLSSLYVVRPANNQQIVFVKVRDNYLEVKAFSSDKGVLWSKNLDLDKELNYQVSSIKVAENGNVYIAGQYYKKEEPVSSFLVAYSPSKNQQKLHTIKSGEKIIDVGYKLQFIENETPVFAGIYGSKKESGYKLFKLNTDNFELQQIISKPFTPAFSEVLWKGAYKPEYYSVNDIVQLKNKNIVIDIEGGAVVAGGHASSFYSSPVYLAAVSEGTEKWNTIIQKYQVQPLSGDLLGHALFYKGNKLYLLYNDDIDNFDADPLKNTREGLIKKKIYVATVEVDETGKAKKLKQITTTKNQNSSFSPGSIKPIDKNTFHFLFMKDGKYHFATLQANDQN